MQGRCWQLELMWGGTGWSCAQLTRLALSASTRPAALRPNPSTAAAVMSRTLEEEAVGEEEEQVENHYDEVEKLQVRGRDSSGSRGAAWPSAPL